MSSKSIFIWVVFAFCACAALPGCSSNKEQAAAVESEKGILAQVADSAIRAADLEKYLEYLPNERKADKAEVEKRLDDLIENELLFNEAIRLGLDRDFSVKRQVRQILINNLLSEAVDADATTGEVSDSEAKIHYERHRSEYSSPMLMKIAGVYIAVPENADKPRRAELEKRAKEVLSLAELAREERAGFAKLIEKFSDVHPKYPLGETGFFDSQGRPFDLPPELVKEAVKLRHVGDVAEHLIETPDGYHVIMLTGKRSESERSFEAARESIKSEIRRERLKEARENFIDQLRRKTEVRLDREAIALFLDNYDAAETQKENAGDDKPPSLPAKIRSNPAP